MKVKLLHCDKLNHFLYPPRVEHKGNAFELDPEENKPMPKNCKAYDSESLGFNDLFS